LTCGVAPCYPEPPEQVVAWYNGYTPEPSSLRIVGQSKSTILYAGSADRPIMTRSQYLCTISCYERSARQEFTIEWAGEVRSSAAIEMYKYHYKERGRLALTFLSMALR